MTISEQVQNDYTVAWQVIGPMARQLSLGELVQPSGTWLKDDRVGVFMSRRHPACYFSLGGGVRNAMGRRKDSMPSQKT